jgi:hypothetical protein
MIEASQRERSIEGRKIKCMMKRTVGVMDYQNNSTLSSSCYQSLKRINQNVGY